MRQKLIKSLQRRFLTEITPHASIKYLLTLPLEEYFNSVISVVYLYTRPKKDKKSIYFNEVISAIGHIIRSKNGLKRDSALAAKSGAFFLYSFEELDILKVMLGKGKNHHQAYVIKIINDEAIIKLWTNLPSGTAEKLPSEVPYEPWTSTRHPSGHKLVKTGNREVLQKITLESHPIIFDCVNKAQKVGWKINCYIYHLHLWALRNKATAFDDIWKQQDPEARITKTREAKAIGSIAKRFLDKTFYHIYYFDFR